MQQHGFFIVLIVFTIVLMSCTTSRGNSYSDSRNSESDAAAAAANRDKPPAEGFRPPDGSVNVTDIIAPIIFISTQSQPSGTVIVRGMTLDSALFVDGAFTFIHEPVLPVGEHSIRVTRFGYRDFECTIYIEKNQQRFVNLVFQPSVCEISFMGTLPQQFDPADPGPSGGCNFILNATAPVTVNAQIRDAGSNIIRRLPPITVTGQTTFVFWDGCDSNGQQVQAGQYYIVAETEANDSVVSTAHAQVTVVQGLFQRSSSLYSGVSGTLFAPDARILTANVGEISVGAIGHLEPLQNSLTGRGTVHVGARIGLDSKILDKGGFEMAFSGLFIVHPGEQSTYSTDAANVTASVKYAFKGSPIPAALYLKGTISTFLDPALGAWPSGWDGPTRFHGVSIGLPLEFANGPFRAFVTPELAASGFYPGYPKPWNVPGFFVWAYVRAGLELTVEDFVVAFSGAIRSAPFANSFTVGWPASVGAELNWHIPRSPLTLSVLATGETSGQNDFYVSLGMGVGIR